MNGKIFEYDKDMKDYVYNLDNDGLASETILYNIMDSHFIKEFINTEVEILEDNTEEIEELDREVQVGYTEVELAHQLSLIKLKINELVRAINKLRKEKE